MNTGKSSKTSTKRNGRTSTGSKTRRAAPKKKERVVEFTPQQNSQIITFCIKGQLFYLTIPEVFVLNHVMIDVMNQGGNFVGLYTDFNKYKVNWSYGPIATNIESVCVK